MKKKMLITLGVIVAVACSSLVGIAVSMNANAPKHPSDYKIGITYEEAVDLSEKPMVALFYADWCSYCMKFMPKFKILSGLYKENYNFVMVNVENKQYAQLVDSMSLTGYPTVYILDPKYDNRVLIPNSIYQNLGRFRVELDRYIRIRGILDKASNNSEN
ncbi:MAG: thioredoxin domain-containing protein [Candidatus Gastranaerophilaceae bacterium]|nr:uncharacterized protein BN819_00402 [Clostridium sp. CAG:967]